MWEYSEEAVAIMSAFKEAFPELVQAVEAEPNCHTYKPEALFPNSANALIRVQEALVFLSKVRAVESQAVSQMTERVSDMTLCFVHLSLTKHSNICFPLLGQTAPYRLPLTPCGCTVMHEDSIRRIEDVARSIQFVSPPCVCVSTNRVVFPLRILYLPLFGAPQVEDKPQHKSGVAGIELMHPLVMPLKDPWV